MDSRWEQDSLPVMQPALYTQPDSRAVLFHRPRPARPELDWKYIVQNEIIIVTNAMRKNQRWNLDRERRANATSSAAYNFCEDAARHGRTNLDMVLEFTAELGNGKMGFGAVEENPLLHGFSLLRARLTLLHELRDLNPSLLLEPFLEVIRSPDTTGPMTGAALSSVEKFINYRVLDPNHPELPAAMSALTHSIVRCRFEATDSVTDEAVLAKILGLLRVILMSEAGQKTLHDKGICEMVEVAFGMIFQGRVNELLRRSAEQTLLVLVQTLFERLTVVVRAKEQQETVAAYEVQQALISPEAPVHRKSIVSPQSVEHHESVNSDGVDHTHTMNQLSPSISVFEHGRDDTSVISVAGKQIITESGEAESEDGGPRIAFATNEQILSGGGTKGPGWKNDPLKASEDTQVTQSEYSDAMASHTAQAARESQAQQEQAIDDSIQPTTLAHPSDQFFHPFGFPAILEMFRVLVTLLDPKNRQHTDSMHRTIALNLLQAGLEVGGRSLGKLATWGFQVQSTTSFAQTTTSTDVPNGNAELISREPPNIADHGAHESVIDSAGLSLDTGSETPSTSAARGSSASRRTSYGSVDDAVFQTNIEAEIAEDAQDRAALMAKELVVNDLCKHLFQLLQGSALNVASSSNSLSSVSILGSTLRCITTLLQSTRQHLKLQQEWLLEWIMDRLDSGVVTWDIEDWDKSASDHKDLPQRGSLIGVHQRATIISGEARTLMLESLAQLCRLPTFAVELYINYDGDMSQRTHLYEELITFLARHSFPDITPGGPITDSSHQALCFDALLILLNHMVERKALNEDISSEYAETSKKASPEVGLRSAQLPPPETLLFNKLRKRILKEGTDRFNENPKEGIPFLQANGFLPDPLSSESLALFFKHTPGINKKLLGEYLSKPKHLDILKSFVNLMDFKHKRFDGALRALLESFRLPGESQQIERIMQVFAGAYFDTIKDQKERDIETVGATFILAYSVIMLNTDQHNPQVRRRMTLEDFMRNLRGLNEEKNFSAEFLKQIYMAIRQNEIVMPEEHEGELGFNYQWKELLKNARHTDDLLACRTNLYDKDMLAFVWNSVLATISYAFDNAEDELTLQKAVVGYHQCATIAANYHLTDIMDSIVVSLAKMSGLLKESRHLPPDTRQSDTQLSAKIGPPFDPWRAEFGRNHRGQAAAVLLFCLINEYGTVVRKGWRWLGDCIRNLFLHSMLPSTLVEVEDFVRGSIIIPRLPDLETSQRRHAGSGTRKEAGIFSTLSNLLSLGSNLSDDWDGYEPTAADMECERRAIRCIRICKIDQFVADSRFLEEDALRHLIGSIGGASFAQQGRLRDMDSSPRSGPVHASHVASTTTNGTLHSPSGEMEGLIEGAAQNLSVVDAIHKFDKGAIFLLELMLNITIQNRDRIMSIWAITLEHISNILKSSGQCHVLLVERAVSGLLRMIVRLGHKDEILPTVIQSLELLHIIPPEVFNGIAETLMAGLLLIFKSDPTILSRNRQWDVILRLLARSSSHPEASQLSFEAACILVSDTPESCVTPENFGECVDLLIGFTAPTPPPVGTGVMATGPTGARASLPESPKSNAEQVAMRKGQPDQAVAERPLRALDKLFRLHHKIPSLVLATNMKFTRAFFEFWLPVLSGLSQQCYHPSREVRQYALTHLQRALLSPELLEGSGTEYAVVWADCFENVLFPLLDELLRPEVAQVDPMGMEETRMRASALLCKIFLQYFPRLQDWEHLPQLWAKILEYTHKYMTAGGTDYLNEGVQESLKNMLLVMSTQGAFQPSDDTTDSSNLWSLTCNYVDSFLPDLKGELFPPLPENAEGPPSAQQPDLSAADALAGIAAQAMALAGPVDSPEKSSVQEGVVEAKV